MMLEGSSTSAPAAQATEPNSATNPEGDNMDIFKASLTLMSMRHAGNPAEWHKTLRDAEKYDPFMFGAWQQDQTQQYVMSQGNGSEPREKRDVSPVSDSETQSEGSSASTILLAENEHDIDPRAGDEQNEGVDEEMTEDEAENLSADGDSDSTGDRKISSSGQEDDEMVGSEFHPSGEAAPDDVEIADSDSPARLAKRTARKSAWRARPRKGKGKVKVKVKGN